MSAPLSVSAVHEVGHALVAHLLGGVVERSEVFGDGSGECGFGGLSRPRRLRAVVAGYVGERLVFGVGAVKPGAWEEDVSEACDIALAIARIGEARRLAARGLDEPTETMLARYQARAAKLIEIAERDVAEILAANRPALRLLAEKLEADGKLDGEQLAALVSEATR